ncbi:hypothetical protein RJ639_033026 [Escallonia herrerae]|uniref:Uncharacterized protein n=1 Tax=Escallonia herrerae TaxID=1293975 RepID=A0AA88WYK0_9ASTE|nr:hypothetical protein RJ639_033026 [Escallonia herrerae]
MADWGPVVIAVVLFVLLTPGLLCQIPGKGRVVEFGCKHETLSLAKQTSSFTSGIMGKTATQKQFRKEH